MEERLPLLPRVLWSRQLEKAGRIREFVTYVCERSFADPAADIHEQELGEKIFGRAPGYDTAEDNIVRVTASQARKKLEQYFSGEGASEPIIIEIPKGQYAPVFRPREAVSQCAASYRVYGFSRPFRVVSPPEGTYAFPHEARSARTGRLRRFCKPRPNRETVPF